MEETPAPLLPPAPVLLARGDYDAFRYLEERPALAERVTVLNVDQTLAALGLDVGPVHITPSARLADGYGPHHSKLRNAWLRSNPNAGPFIVSG